MALQNRQQSQTVSIIIVMALSTSEFVDYYKLLDLQPNASSAQIRNAFINKAKQNHPDVGGSTESMRHINAAYKTLTSYSHKAAYDLLHSFHTGKKEVDYRVVGPQTTAQTSPNDFSDEYIDWFIDALYAEYSNDNKAKLNFAERVKKFFKI